MHPPPPKTDQCAVYTPVIDVPKTPGCAEPGFLRH